MTQIGQRFGLSAKLGDGVFCSGDGLFVGDVPLLERVEDTYGRGQWRPRPQHDLNSDLEKRYGLPVDIQGKTSGLFAIARALGNGDIIHAQIATLHLQLPDPPSMRKSTRTAGEVLELARRLSASGLLKADWDLRNIHAGLRGVQIASAGDLRPAAPLPLTQMRGLLQCKVQRLPHHSILRFRRQLLCLLKLRPLRHGSILAKAYETHIPTDRNVSRNGLKRYNTAAN